MKKIIALLISGVMLCSLSACQKEPEKTGATLEYSIENSYRSEKLDKQQYSIDTLISDGTYHDALDWSLIGRIGENVLFAHGANQIVVYHPADDSVTPLTLDYYDVHYISEEKHVSQWCICNGGGLTVIYRAVEDNRYNLNVPVHVEHYDTDLHLLSEQEVPALNAIGYYTFFQEDSQGNFYVLSETAQLHIFDSDFNELGIIDDIESISHSFIGGDGKCYITYYLQSEGYPKQIHMGYIDTEQMKIINIDFDFNYVRTVEDGDKHYLFYYSDKDSLYGVDYNNQKTEIINWNNSDFNGIGVEEFCLLPDGRAIITIGDSYVSNGMYYSWNTPYLLTRRTDEELSRMKYLTLSAVTNPFDDLKRAVTHFNRQSTDIHIVYMDYSVYNAENIDYTQGLEQLKSDMINGKVADIICTDGLPFQSFYSKGLFEDLTTRITNDKDFSDENYFMNFFYAQSYGNGIPHIGFTYTIQTLTAKTEFVGEQSGLTIPEFMELVSNRPEDMKVFRNMTKDEALSYFVLNHLQSFVDYQNSSNSFDSPEMMQMLELCNSYPVEGDPLATADDHGVATRANRALFCEQYLYRPYLWHEILEGYFDNAPVTWVGYPTSTGGNGAYFEPSYRLAVNAQSFYSDEAWTFFKFLLSEKEQLSECTDTLPVNRAAMEQMMYAATLPMPENSMGHFFPLGMYNSISLKDATPEEMQDFSNYIEHITESCWSDRTIENIISEEAGMFFAGDQTSEKAAKMIHDRVNLYLSEQQ